MCKAGLPRTRFNPAQDRALHSPRLLSTAFLRPAVQTVGNRVPNSVVFTALPAFHFLRDQFSKTWIGVIHAPRVVSVPLSTFPVGTVTATKMGLIIFAFHRSRSFAPRNPQGEARRDFQGPPRWCRVGQTDKGANAPCLARGLSWRKRSHREPHRWKSR
jgi:hypothetical protein